MRGRAQSPPRTARWAALVTVFQLRLASARPSVASRASRGSLRSSHRSDGHDDPGRHWCRARVFCLELPDLPMAIGRICFSTQVLMQGAGHLGRAPLAVYLAEELQRPLFKLAALVDRQLEEHHRLGCVPGGTEAGGPGTWPPGPGPTGPWPGSPCRRCAPARGACTRVSRLVPTHLPRTWRPTAKRRARSPASR
jgi:hypothetical protein